MINDATTTIGNRFITLAAVNTTIAHLDAETRTPPISEACMEYLTSGYSGHDRDENRSRLRFNYIHFSSFRCP